MKDEIQEVQEITSVECRGNGCEFLNWDVIQGPKVRLRNNHPNSSLDVTIGWSTILGGGKTTYRLFPGDDKTFDSPRPEFIGVSSVEARVK